MRIFFFCLLLLASSMAFAQQSDLKGKIVDTLEKRNLHHAVISLLRQSDSTLYRFTRSASNGEFLMKKIDTGKYFLFITYPGFADFGDELYIKEPTVDLGSLPLIQKSALLETVIIKQHWSIRLKGDTVEYKADSFKVAEGANVKDLLRQLPGLQVDKNGQITAQGQKVEKVLVDGEEFFSDDPAVVIENLRADAVDKVQSYDKKSDQAEFTGVDDGSRSKTLNLVLKDDKKKGYMGKIVAGGGTEERYSGEAMLNYFKGKKKASVYGIASNTGTIGLGWEDRSRYGGGNDFEDAEVEMGAGFIMINSDNDGDFEDWGNSYEGEGIPRTIKGGAHFSDKWKSDQQKINGNYTIKDIRNFAEGNSLYKYLLPDSSYYLKENHTSSTTSLQQIFGGIYDIKFDSLSSIRIKLNGKFNRSSTNTSTNSETDDEELNPVNLNSRINTNDSREKTFLASALWRQKFKKKGRTLSLTASQKQNENNSDGFLLSYTDFFTSPFNRDTIDQYKTSLSKKYTTQSKLVYTEPAGKKGILEFNYSFQRTASHLNRQSFEEKGGKYSELNNAFSLRYGLLYLSNSAGIKYQYNSKKLTANIGTNIGISDYNQKDSNDKQVRHMSYTNIFPTSRITYRFTTQKSLNLTYSGTPGPPGIEQIQPIRENSNPLFITIGNPDLDQSFRHNFSLFFTDFKMLTGRNIWINASVSTTDKAIVTSQVINSGITTQQYINTSGNFNYYFYGSYGFKIAKADTYVGLTLNSNGNNYVNFINGKKNTSKNRTTGLSLHSSKYEEDKYMFSLDAGIKYNSSTSTISSFKNNFWTQNYGLDAEYSITKRFTVGSDVEFDLREKTEAFTGNNNFITWGMEVSYKIFKKRNGIFTFEINDLLGQRRGYNREFTSNYLYEKNYNTLGRYALLSFNWNFNKSPGTTK